MTFRAARPETSQRPYRAGAVGLGLGLGALTYYALDGVVERAQGRAGSGLATVVGFAVAAALSGVS